MIYQHTNRKKGGFIGNWKHRKFILDPDVRVLTYYDPKSDREKGKILLIEKIQLNRGDVRNVAKSGYI